MSRKIALLRGVNVGGNNKLPMKELAKLLERIGCENVRTYIQSGNVVYDGAATGGEIAAAIEKKFGFAPHTFVMTAAALNKAASGCPYKQQAEAEPKSVHLFFLGAAPDKSATASFDAIKTASENYTLTKTVLYLHTPEGLLASKIAEKVDRILKTKTTARNWNTVRKLIELAKEAS
jgi:uncharacterized protein (DUF1697 family)